MLSTALHPKSSVDDLSGYSFNANLFSAYLVCRGLPGLLIFIVLLLSSACVPLEKPASSVPSSSNSSSNSVKHIENPNRRQVLFAQSALSKLGFNVGSVDGIWGPRSASAMRRFEAQQKITSTKGFLTDINLNQLTKVSGLKQSDFSQTKNSQSKSRPADSAKVIPAQGISKKLKGKLSITGPQMVIIENTYSVFTQPDSKSDKTLTLQPGAAIYILSNQKGWYEIESINRRKGYIQAD